MSKRYVLFNFMTGDIINQNLPPNKGNDSVERNIIDGGLINVEVAWHELSAQARNDWSAYFLRLGRGVALVDDAEPITSKGAIPGAGFINKVTAPTGKGFLTVQGASVNEYLAARLAMLVWEEWTEPDLVSTTGETADDPVISGASWDGLLRHWAWLCFKQPTVAGAPRPPSIIRNGLAETTPGSREMPNEYDGTTVLGAMEAIRNDLSGVGVEWQFVPYFTDETRTRICFDLEVGTEANPHLNEVPMSIELSANSQYKITNHSTMHDSTEVFNKVLLRYQLPEETEGLPGKQKIFPKWGASNEIPLVEKYVNTSSVLTPAQLEALTAAYIEDGKTGGSEVSFTIAGEWNKTEWINNLGKLVTFTGLPDTISAGHSLTVRCVGLKMNAETSVVEATFAQLATVYPQTPQKKKIKKAITAVEKQGWTKYGPKGKLVHPDRDVQKRLDELNFDVENGGGGGGGGEMPETPVIEEPDTGEWTNEGVFNPDQTWGSEGRDPFDTWAPTGRSVVGFEDYKTGYQSFTSWSGVAPLDPRTLFQHEGNRLYGFDHAQRNWATKFTPTGNTEYGGGIVGTPTGAKKTPYEPIYIKMGALNGDGTITDFRDVGSLPAEMVKQAIPEYEDVGYDASETVHIGAGYWLTGWYVAGRLYIGLAASIMSAKDGLFTSGKYYYNGKITVFSVAVKSDGTLGTTWKVEPWTFYDDVLPVGSSIARYGKTVVFGSGIPVPTMKIKNLTAAQIKMTFATVGSRKINRNETTAINAYITKYSENPLKNGHLLVSPIIENWAPRFYYPSLEPALDEVHTTENYYNIIGPSIAWNHGGLGDKYLKTNWVKDFSVADSALAPWNAVTIDRTTGWFAAYTDITGSEKWSFAAVSTVALDGNIATGQAADYSGSYQDEMDLATGRWRITKVHPNTVFPNMTWTPVHEPVASGIQFTELKTVVLGNIIAAYQGGGYNTLFILKKDSTTGNWNSTAITQSPYGTFGGSDSQGPAYGDLLRPPMFNQTKWYRSTLSNTFSYNGRIWIFNIGGPGTGIRVGWRSMKAVEG